MFVLLLAHTDFKLGGLRVDKFRGHMSPSLTVCSQKTMTTDDTVYTDAGSMNGFEFGGLRVDKFRRHLSHSLTVRSQKTMTTDDTVYTDVGSMNLLVILQSCEAIIFGGRPT